MSEGPLPPPVRARAVRSAGMAYFLWLFPGGNHLYLGNLLQGALQMVLGVSMPLTLVFGFVAILAGAGSGDETDELFRTIAGVAFLYAVIVAQFALYCLWKAVDLFTIPGYVRKRNPANPGDAGPAADAPLPRARRLNAYLLWLLPGGNHLYLGRRPQGALQAMLLVLLFLIAALISLEWLPLRFEGAAAVLSIALLGAYVVWKAADLFVIPRHAREWAAAVAGDADANGAEGAEEASDE